MKSILTFCIVILFAIVPYYSYAQDEEGEDKTGKLGKLAGSYEDEDESSKKNKNKDEERDAFFAHLAMDIVGHAISNMQPGPYPYNGSASNFSPADPYPGGILHTQFSYFRHDENLFGLLWRFNYAYQRFGISVDLINLLEDIGDRYDNLNLAAGRLSWDFIGKQDFRLSGQLGVRNLFHETVSTSGPEAGFRFIGLPRKPFIVEGSGTVASINGRQFSTLSGTFGLMIKRVHLFMGGQIIRSSEIAIDGVLLGLRLWL